MRDATFRRRLRWRSTPAAAAPGGDRRRGPAEAPAADGIRHDLVARVRAEIAAGTYDTEERWAAAEDALLRRAAGPA
jgi:hypothetical protein